jgi:hypothetical protein
MECHEPKVEKEVLLGMKVQFCKLKLMELLTVEVLELLHNLPLVGRNICIVVAHQAGMETGL